MGLLKNNLIKGNNVRILFVDDEVTLVELGTKMLNKMGYETGIDSEKIIQAAKLLKNNVDGNYSGHHILIDDKI